MGGGDGVGVVGGGVGVVEEAMTLDGEEGRDEGKRGFSWCVEGEGVEGWDSKSTNEAIKSLKSSIFLFAVDISRPWITFPPSSTPPSAISPPTCPGFPFSTSSGLPFSPSCNPPFSVSLFSPDPPFSVSLGPPFSLLSGIKFPKFLSVPKTTSIFCRD